MTTSGQDSSEISDPGLDEMRKSAEDFPVSEAKGREIRTDSGASPTTSRQPADALSGEFGRYRISKWIGKDSSGDVYLAVDAAQNQQVLLKVPHFPADQKSEAADRFHLAAQAAAKLDHRNICSVLDDGEIDEIHYVAMTYLEGEPLSKFVSRSKPPPSKQVVAVIRKIAVALNDAHKQGIFHGGFRPANIIIDPEREPNLMDFGLSLRLLCGDSQQDVLSDVPLTAGYLSPEQINSELGEVGPSGDIFRLGVILFEMLTGRRPFIGSGEAVKRKILNNEPLMPSKLRAELHPSLDLICLTMLAKQPEKRYSSMEDVIVALDEFLQISRTGSTINSASGDSVMMSDFYRAFDEFEEQTAEMDRHQERVRELVGEHKYAAAEKLLKKIASFKDPKLADYVTWAKKELRGICDMPLKMQEESIAAYRVACDFVEQHNYDQAVNVLEQIPPKYITDEAAELLAEVIVIKREVDVLIVALDRIDTRSSYKEHRYTIERLLELKPGFKRALELQKEFANRRTRFTKKKNTAGTWASRNIPPWPVCVGIGLFVVAVILLLGAATSYFDFSKGTIKITLNDPTMTIVLDGQELAPETLQRPLLLKRGRHRLSIMQKGVELTANDLQIVWGENPPILIENSAK